MPRSSLAPQCSTVLPLRTRLMWICITSNKRPVGFTDSKPRSLKVPRVPWDLQVGNPLTLESIDFDARFMIRAEDRRSAVMLLDEGMMQWLLDCDHVSFEITGDRGQALVKRSSESTYQPGLVPGWHLSGHSEAPHGRSRRADPVELELLFKFWDGFVPRLPAILRAEFAASTT